MNLKEIVEQLEMCDYECEAGPLEKNVAFVTLKGMAEAEEATRIAKDKWHEENIKKFDAEERTCITCGHGIESECHKPADLPECGTGNEQWIPRK